MTLPNWIPAGGIRAGFFGPNEVEINFPIMAAAGMNTAIHTETEYGSGYKSTPIGNTFKAVKARWLNSARVAKLVGLNFLPCMV